MSRPPTMGVGIGQRRLLLSQCQAVIRLSLPSPIGVRPCSQQRLVCFVIVVLVHQQRGDSSAISFVMHALPPPLLLLLRRHRHRHRHLRPPPPRLSRMTVPVLPTFYRLCRLCTSPPPPPSPSWLIVVFFLTSSLKAIDSLSMLTPPTQLPSPPTQRATADRGGTQS